MSKREQVTHADLGTGPVCGTNSMLAYVIHSNNCQRCAGRLDKMLLAFERLIAAAESGKPADVKRAAKAAREVLESCAGKREPTGEQGERAL